MTWVFVVLFITVSGITGELSRPFQDAVACERARAQVIMAYRDGEKIHPPGVVKILTLKCRRQ